MYKLIFFDLWIIIIYWYEHILIAYIKIKKNYRSNIYQKIAFEIVSLTINLLFMCKNIISLKNINENFLFIFYSLILLNKFSDL